MERATGTERLAGRVVVVSPHLDDGVLSLGAAMWAAARRGARVELLTVFGCDPGSEAQAGGWDRRGGYRTEGESARARREEDRRACAVLGAVPVWLPFGSVDYERHGSEREVVESVLSATDGADAVLLPGAPLTHPDHDWLVRSLDRVRLPEGAIGWYAEQPYTRRTGRGPAAPDWLEVELGEAPAFERAQTSVRARLAKWRAVREYRSQLPLLGMRRSLRRGPGSVAWIPEAVAWPPARDRGQG